MYDRSRECILRILNNANYMSTHDILTEARKYPDICRGCRSGSNIIRIAMKLLEEGLITREIGKGGFIWKIR